MFLGDVLEVRSGLVVSRKKAKDENSAKYKYKQLNLRSVRKEGYIIEDELEVLSTDEIISSDYPLHPAADSLASVQHTRGELAVLASDGDG